MSSPLWTKMDNLLADILLLRQVGLPCKHFFLTIPLIDRRWWNLCRNRRSYMVCSDWCHRIRTSRVFITTWLRLPPSQVGMIVDRGHDFPISIEQNLLKYGREMWMFRDQSNHDTTRARNSYKGEHRGHAFNSLLCHLSVLLM